MLSNDGKDYGNRLNQAEKDSLNDALLSSIQIFTDTEDRPDPIASGILITISKRFFIVTAAHVFNEYYEVFYVMLPGKSAINIDKKRVRKTPMPYNGHDHDKIDIATIEIDILSAAEFTKRGLRFLDFSDFKIRHVDANHRYGVVGYIAGKTKLKDDIIKPSVFQYMSSCVNEFNYNRYGFNRSTTVAVLYDREIISDINPNPHLAPKIEGISGGGLWLIGEVINKFPVVLFDPKKNRKLIGIIIEQKLESKVILATKIDVVVDFIIQKYRIAKFKKPPFI